MKAFIDTHHDVYGVEPICQALPIAPSTYRAHALQQRILDANPRAATAYTVQRPMPEPPPATTITCPVSRSKRNADR